MTRFVLLIAVLFSSAQCKTRIGEEIPQIVLDAILNTECLRVNGMLEANFIRISLKKDVETAKKNGIPVKRHIVKCNNPSKCSEYTNKLLGLNIKNFDLGPYQINYLYHGYRWKDNGNFQDFFKYDTAEQRTREILGELILKYGYSWRTIGRYNHFDASNKWRNINYYSKIYKYIYGEKPKLFSKK